MNPPTSAIMQQVSLNPVDVFVTVFLILGIPLKRTGTLEKIAIAMNFKIKQLTD